MTSPQSLADKLAHAKRESKALKAQLQASKLKDEELLAAFDKCLKRLLGATFLNERETNIMADFANDAAEIIGNYSQVATQNAKDTRRPHPFAGICRNCGHPIDQGTFCPGGDCRDDYSKRSMFYK